MFISDYSSFKLKGNSVPHRLPPPTSLLLAPPLSIISLLHQINRSMMKEPSSPNRPSSSSLLPPPPPLQSPSSSSAKKDTMNINNNVDLNASPPLLVGEKRRFGGFVLLFNLNINSYPQIIIKIIKISRNHTQHPCRRGPPSQFLHPRFQTTQGRPIHANPGLYPSAEIHSEDRGRPTRSRRRSARQPRLLSTQSTRQEIDVDAGR